ncbi:7104_t:CDS:2 [Paraglomus occultum]|uniref:7104_t:CDS:1 n=1 Tax=Paraglomus occultum TaxID=144539 RepID=A0A9N8WIQ6_9GLOM|nr:7104_t:CDS:2 [Paraglomus occultum]
MESEINYIRQQNTRLIVQITGLEVENADVKVKYDEAMNEIMILRAELKSRIEDNVVENVRRAFESLAVLYEGGRSVGYKDVQRFEGVFTGTNKELTIGILVARFKKRFTRKAGDRAKVAKSNGYNIILTDEQNLYSDLIEYIKSNRLDGSNKNIELQFVEVLKELRQIRAELAEVRQETQQLRAEFAQTERSRSEDHHNQRLLENEQTRR